MGNTFKKYDQHYYNTINSSDLFAQKENEITKFENIFKNHINKYIMDSDTEVNDEIKMVIDLNDFYKLLNSKYYEGYLKIYERKIYGLRHPEASEDFVKSNREMPDYLCEIIKWELLKIIKKIEDNKNHNSEQTHIIKTLTKNDKVINLDKSDDKEMLEEELMILNKSRLILSKINHRICEE